MEGVWERIWQTKTSNVVYGEIFDALRLLPFKMILFRNTFLKLKQFREIIQIWKPDLSKNSIMFNLDRVISFSVCMYIRACVCPCVSACPRQYLCFYLTYLQCRSISVTCSFYCCTKPLNLPVALFDAKRWLMRQDREDISRLVENWPMRRIGWIATFTECTVTQKHHSLQYVGQFNWPEFAKYICCKFTDAQRPSILLHVCTVLK